MANGYFTIGGYKVPTTVSVDDLKEKQEAMKTSAPDTSTGESGYFELGGYKIPTKVEVKKTETPTAEIEPTTKVSIGDVFKAKPSAFESNFSQSLLKGELNPLQVLNAGSNIGKTTAPAQTVSAPKTVENYDTAIEAKKKEIEAAKAAEEKAKAAAVLARASTSGMSTTVKPEAQSAIDAAEEAKKKVAQLESELSDLSTQRYGLENSGALYSLFDDKASGQKYMQVKTLESDMEKIAYMIGAYNSGENSAKTREYKAYLKEKYGLDDSAFTLAPDMSLKGGTSLQQLNSQLSAQAAAQKADLKAAGYDYDRMSGYSDMLGSQFDYKQETARLHELAKEHPVAGSIMSVAMAPFQGIDYAKQALGNIGRNDPANPESYVPMNVYEMEATNFVTTVRGTVSEEIAKNTDWEIAGQNVASFLYDTGMSIADSTLQVATFGSMATYVMGMSAAATTTKDILERGGNNRQALIGGLAAGAAEAIFEKISIDQLLKAKNVTSFKSWLKETMKQAGVEASEEAFTEVANILSDAAIMGEKSNFNLLVEQYMSQGMSEEEAKEKAYLDQIGQVAWSAVGGAISGGSMGGPVNAVNGARARASYSLVGAELERANADYAIVEEGLKLAEGSEGRAIAEELAQQLDKATTAEDFKLDETKVGQLGAIVAQETEKARKSGAISDQQAAQVQQVAHSEEKVVAASFTAFQQAGDTAAVADRKADVMERVLAGDQTLTDSQLRKLELQSETTWKAIESLTGVTAPATTSTKERLATVRGIINTVAAENSAQEAQAAEVEQMRQEMAQAAAQAQAKTAQVESAKAAANAQMQAKTEEIRANMEQIAQENATAQTATRPDEESVKQAFRPKAEAQATPDIQLDDGTSQSAEEFITLWLATHKGASQAEANSAYSDAVRLNRSGMLYPATAKSKGGEVKHSVSRRQRTAQGHDLRTEPKRATTTEREVGKETSEVNRAVESRPEAESKAEEQPAQESEGRALTKEQEWTEKYVNAVLKGSVIKGVKLSFEGDGFAEGANGYYDHDTKTIYLNAGKHTTKSALIDVLAHEMVHGGQKADSKLVDDIIAAFESDEVLGADAVDAMLSEVRDRYVDFYVQKDGLSREAAEAKVDLDFAKEELAADLMRVAFENTDGAMGKLAQTKPSLLQSALAKAKEMLAKLGVRQSKDTEAESVRKAMRNECEMLVYRLEKALRNSGNESTIKATEEVRHSAEEAVGNDRRRMESLDEFLERGKTEGLRVVRARGRDGGYGYRPVHRPAGQSVCAVARKELTAFGVPCFIHDGHLEINSRGRTKTIDPPGLTLWKQVVALSNTSDIDGLNTAAHEAYHFWGPDARRAEYENTVLDNLNWKSEPFNTLYTAIDDLYFGGNLDITDEKQLKRFNEELVAYITGDLHSGERTEALHEMLLDFDAVQQAWQELVHANAPDYQFDNSTQNDEGTPAVSEDAFSNTRYSVSAREDADYRRAVESGDITTAQRMVDKAAKKAGYDKKVFHGTNAQFNIFDTRTNSVAAQTKEKHNWDATYPAGTIFLAETRRTAMYYGSTVKSLYLNTEGMKTFKHTDMEAHDAMDHLHGNEVLKYPVIAVEGSDQTIYATRGNTRVKSSEPAIYDDNGDLIPLSKRFNRGNPDTRYSITDISTEEFRKWFHDDSGELTNPDGTPKVFLRGDTFSGATQFYSGAENHSGGIFFSTDQETAGFYAHQYDDSFSMEAPEFKPRVFESWNDAFMSTQDGELGYNVAVERAGPNEWELMVRRREENRVRWETLASFPNTADGLTQFNAQYGQILRDASVENPAYMQAYLSAQNTLVIDAQEGTWDSVDSAGLRTNDIARQAWEDGYDMVIVKNVQDGAPEGMEFDEFDNFKAKLKAIDVYIAKDSAQVKSVYNIGTFDPTNPDVRYSVDWGEQVDAYLNGTINDKLESKDGRASTMYVAKEPTALLQSLGLSDLPLITTQKHVGQMLGQRWDEQGKVLDRHNHELSADVVKMLPELIAKPVLVVKADPNGSAKGGVNIITDQVDKHGDPITITIKADQPSFTYNGVSGPAHFVNMFGRDNFEEYLEAVFKNRQVLYINKERANSVQFGASEARHERTYGIDSDVIVAEKDPTVKPAERQYSVDPDADINPETGYKNGSFADSIMQIWVSGDKGQALERALELSKRLEKIYEEEQKRLRQGKARKQREAAAAFIPRPKLTESDVERNRREINELIEKFGKMEQTSAAQREVNFPEQIDESTHVRGFMQTAAATTNTPEYIVSEIERDILTGEASATYTPVRDAETQRWLEKKMESDRKAYGDAGAFERELSEWRAIVDGDTFPTKRDVALGEQLYLDAAQNGDVQTAMQLLGELAAVGTQSGQVIQAMSMIKKMTPSGKLYYLRKAADRLARTSPYMKKHGLNIVIDNQLAKNLLDARTQAELDAAMDALMENIAGQIPSTVADKWNAWRYLSMLGNPRTHIRNVLGNAIFAPVRFVKDVAAMGMEHMFIRDKSKRTKGFGNKAAREFAKRDAMEMQEILQSGGKHNPVDAIMEKRKIFTGALGWVEPLSKGNSRALEAEDWWFLKGAYQRALAGFITARGIDPATLAGPKSTQEGRKLLSEARAYATLEAQKATYRDMSKVAATLSQLKRKGPVWSMMLDGVVPFTKTPINIIKRGFEYSPLGFAQTIVKACKKESGAEVIDSLASNLTGTGIALAGWFMARAGMLVAGLGDDPEDEFAALQGNQGYSLVLGGKSITIDWMAPGALPLFVGAEFARQLEQLEELAADGELTEKEMLQQMLIEDLPAALMTTFEPMLSLSMLDGLNDVLSANRYDSADQMLINVAKTMATNYFTQGVPTILGQVTRTIDDSRRAAFTPAGTGPVTSWLRRTFQSSVLAKIPVAGESRMLYIDAWGRADTEESVAFRAFENFLCPGYINDINESEMENELVRLAEALDSTAVYPKRAEKSFTVDKKTYAMSQDEYQSHLIERGQLSYKLVTDIVNSAAYAGMTDEEKARAVTTAYDYASELAKLHTNENYAASTWVLKLEDMVELGVDPADYMLLDAKADINNLNIRDVALAEESLSDRDKALIYSSKYTTPKAFADPIRTGYQYTLDEAMQEEFTELFRDTFVEEFAELAEKGKYQKADQAEREELVSDLQSEVAEATRKAIAKQLRAAGQKSQKKD